MERTLILVKPDAVKRGLNGVILMRFEKKRLKLVGVKMLHVDKALAEKHYAMHKEKPFFPGLLEYITSSPIVAAIFEGENVIETSRKVMGSTDPAKAEPGTIRADFGLDIEHNSVHGSDSPENAQREIKLFFRDEELFSY